MARTTADPLTPPDFSHDPGDAPVRRVAPVELAVWVEARLPRITRRWLREVRARYRTSTTGINGLLEEFLGVLAGFLPPLLGPYRDQVEPLWLRTAELFGVMAAKRGLAAGEVVEEFQVLREVLIRLLAQDPPLSGRARVTLREILRLNRAIDMGVTQASVGHTDALFFSLFEGSGIPEAPPTAETLSELRDQLEAIRAELGEIVGEIPGSWAAEVDLDP